MLARNTFAQIEGIENDGRCDADDNKHDLRQFVDAEGDEQNRQQRERHNLVEELDESEKEHSDVWKHRHVQPEQHGGKEKHDANQETPAGGGRVLP